MSSGHYAHHRTSPPTTRKSLVKTARPALLGASKISLKGNGKDKQGADKGEDTDPETFVGEEEDDDDMATSFLQFCTTCDRQILVPKNSLLYCSERCKRIDAEHIPSYLSYTSPSRATYNDESDADAYGSKTRSPVGRAMPIPRLMVPARIPPKAHEGKPDLDPTEWKPKCPHRPTSDASNYLGQFHRKPPTSWSPRRSAAIHAQTVSSVPLTAPSLSATPSASSTSSSGDSVAGTPYNFTNRSLMHPDSTAFKPIDLVTPHNSSAFSGPAKPTGQTKLAIKVSDPPGAAENIPLAGELSYEKKWSLDQFRRSSASGNLKTLLSPTTFGHKATM